MHTLFHILWCNSIGTEIRMTSNTIFFILYLKFKLVIYIFQLLSCILMIFLSISHYIAFYTYSSSLPQSQNILRCTSIAININILFQGWNISVYCLWSTQPMYCGTNKVIYYLIFYCTWFSCLLVCEGSVKVYSADPMQFSCIKITYILAWTLSH